MLDAELHTFVPCAHYLLFVFLAGQCGCDVEKVLSILMFFKYLHKYITLHALSRNFYFILFYFFHQIKM